MKQNLGFRHRFWNERSRVSNLLLSITLVAALAGSVMPTQTPWKCVSRDRLLNISGIALFKSTIDEVSFVVVHDNVGKQQPRASILTVVRNKPLSYNQLVWPTDALPEDLEAITAVPNVRDTFMALTSAGMVYHIRVNQKAMRVEVINKFMLPEIPIGANFEGFALYLIGNSILAVWAERGEGKSATLFWNGFKLSGYEFTDLPPKRENVTVTVTNATSAKFVRSISDVKVNPQGDIFVSAAFDTNDDNGPFASAVYRLGHFITGPRPDFKSEQTVLLQVKDHKIEAIEFVPKIKDRLSFGTDDENFGAALYIDW